MRSRTGINGGPASRGEWLDRRTCAYHCACVSVVRHGVFVALILAVGLAATAGATEVSAASAIRPASGAPDPRAMVLTSEDLGRAKVTAQRYYKDADFPSVISYVREFEDGRFGGVPLLFVSSEAEVGTSASSTTRFLRALRIVFVSKEGRELIVASIEEELGEDGLISDFRIGRPRDLGVGDGSFDLLVTARLLGLRLEFHLAVFRVERVLGYVSATGEPGRRLPLAVMARMAGIMAARTKLELAPRTIELPVVTGPPVVGQTLTATSGTWSRTTGKFAYQWQRCDAAGTGCTGIAGAVGQSYVVANPDFGSTLRVAVTARNTVGSATARSAPTGVVSGFIDAFDGDRVDPFWALITAGTGPAIAQANGQLEITLPAGTSLEPSGFANAAALMTCRFAGDFDIQVDYRLLSGLLPVDGINVSFDAIEFAGGSSSGVHGMFVHNAGGSNHGISTHFPDPGVFRPPYNDFVSDHSLAGTLRLVRTTTGGVTTTTASRLTGSSWSFTSLPYAAPASQAAQLSVWTNLTSRPGEIKVAFDNFKISSGAMTCPR